jgi:hypothetical protein
MIMPARSSPKREREFKHLEKRFQKEHRYPGREDEVAARIVNKQRAKFGETKAARQNDKEGKSPDHGLPLQDYQHMTIPEIAGKLDDLSTADIKRIRTYETKHKNRKGLLQKLDRRLMH